MPNVDSLSVGIGASANTAVNEIDRLNNKLHSLANAMNGISGSNLSNFTSSLNYLTRSIKSINDAGVKTADFTRIATQLGKLNKIDTSNFPTIATNLTTLNSSINSLANMPAVSTNVVDMVSSISKFGSANMQKAITNIPLLATQLKNMFATLSTAPRVSGNIIRMTQALANLAGTGSRVRVSTDVMRRSIDNFSLSAIRGRTATFSLAAAFGRFYANYFLVMRGIKMISKAVTGSMNYVETYNYFSVTMKKIGNQFGKDYKQFSKGFDDLGNKLGYSSAEEYANSFSARLNELTKKMTGFEVGQNGELLSSGELSLGLDPERVMNFQASISAITNSVGMLGETSVNTSKALTMLAADMSSLKNIDLSTVMSNLQSGLIGQSRVLYKYGIDITNASLAQVALAHNVSKSVSEMSQSEKMQLRLLAILEQSRVAWTDQIQTINSAGNQYRVLKQNLASISRTLGNLFMPLVKQVLPMINGLVIALRRLFETLGFQIYGETWLTDINSGISQGMQELPEELADGLDEATESAKKLKKQLQGFDELNVLNTNENTGVGGIGIDLGDDIADALAEYEEKWKEAFENIENLAENFANRITIALQPIKDWFSDFITDVANGDWEAIGEDLSNIVIGAFNLGSDMLDKVNWKQVGENIGEFLLGIKWSEVFASGANFFKKLFNAAVDVWVGSFETAPIETAFVTVFGFLSFTKVGRMIAKRLATSLIAPLATTITTSLASLGGIGGLLTMDLGTILGAGTVAEIGIAIGTAIIGGIIAAIAGFEIGKLLGKFFLDENLYGDFKWFGEGGFFETMFGNYDSVLDGVITHLDALKNMFSDVLTTIYDVIDGTVWLTTDLRTGLSDAVDKIFEKFQLKGLKAIYDEFIYPVFTSDSISTWLENQSDATAKVLGKIKTNLVDRLNEMIGTIESFINLALKGYAPLIHAMSLVGDLFGVEIPNEVHLGRIKGYAKGGYPEMGELFYAGEGGVTEMMGSINGRTAVAGSAEITGIADAVYTTGQTEASLLSTAVSLLQVIADKEFGITDGQIAQSVVRSNRESQNRTGRPLLV